MKNLFQFRQRFSSIFTLIVFSALTALTSPAAPTDDVYLLGPDSAPHPGVPQGKIVGPLTLASEVFTNTTRHYWV